MKRGALAAFFTVMMVFLAPQAKAAGETELYIDKGPITLGNGTVSGYDASGAFVDVYDDDGFLIRQSAGATTTKNTIKVDGGSHKLTFSGITINVDNEAGVALEIKGNASVELTLTGANSLTGGDDNPPSGLSGSPAILIASGSSLIITDASSGSLTATGAAKINAAACGILCDGSITVNGGAVNANGGSNRNKGGDGISVKGSVTVNAGVLNATGGNDAQTRQPGGSAISGEGSVIVAGTGKLNATGGNGNGGGGTGIALSKYSGDVSIRDSAVVMLTGGDHLDTTGWYYGGGAGVTGRNLTVSGSAQLTCRGGDGYPIAPFGTAINVEYITIGENAIVDAQAVAYGSGMVAQRSVTIAGNARVTAVGGPSDRYNVGVNYGIMSSYGSVTISDNADVTATGFNLSDGISATYCQQQDAVKISGGIVRATGGPGQAGLSSDFGGIEISAGTVTATGGTDGNGIECPTVRKSLNDVESLVDGYFININGGFVTATGNGTGAGIYSGNRPINITAGTVTATGGDSGSGINCPENSIDINSVSTTVKAAVTVSGGTLTATGKGGGFGINCDDVLTLSGGATVAEGAGAFKKAPVIPSSFNYMWKKSSADIYAYGGYSFAPADTYTDIRAGLTAELVPQGSYTKGSSADISFVIGRGIPSSALGAVDFASLTMDGVLVPPGSATFSVSDGSLVIGFVPSYLDGLSAGNHTVVVTLTGAPGRTYSGSLQTTLSIIAATPAPGRVNPSTGVG